MMKGIIKEKIKSSELAHTINHMAEDQLGLKINVNHIKKIIRPFFKGEYKCSIDDAEYIIDRVMNILQGDVKVLSLAKIANQVFGKDKDGAIYAVNKLKNQSEFLYGSINLKYKIKGRFRIPSDCKEYYDLLDYFNSIKNAVEIKKSKGDLNSDEALEVLREKNINYVIYEDLKNLQFSNYVFQQGLIIKRNKFMKEVKSGGFNLVSRIEVYEKLDRDMSLLNELAIYLGRIIILNGNNTNIDLNELRLNSELIDDINRGHYLKVNVKRTLEELARRNS